MKVFVKNSADIQDLLGRLDSKGELNDNLTLVLPHEEVHKIIKSGRRFSGELKGEYSTDTSETTYVYKSNTFKIETI